MRHMGSILLLATIAAVAPLSGLPVDPAEATNGLPAPVRRQAVARPGNTVVVETPANVVIQPGSNVTVAPAPNRSGFYHPQPQNFGPCYPFGCNYRGPSYPFGNNYARPPAPVTTYVNPGHVARRWVSPHWARQWMPQHYAYQAWVPGYYSVGGWVPGYYEDRTAESGGYYEQVWVDGYWEE